MILSKKKKRLLRQLQSSTRPLISVTVNKNNLDCPLCFWGLVIESGFFDRVKRGLCVSGGTGDRFPPAILIEKLLLNLGLPSGWACSIARKSINSNDIGDWNAVWAHFGDTLIYVNENLLPDNLFEYANFH